MSDKLEFPTEVKVCIALGYMLIFGLLGLLVYGMFKNPVASSDSTDSAVVQTNSTVEEGQEKQEVPVTNIMNVEQMTNNYYTTEEPEQ